MNKFDNTVNMDQWTTEELHSAIAYYKQELLKNNDDQEHNWFLRQIDNCNAILQPKSEWEDLFA